MTEPMFRTGSSTTAALRRVAMGWTTLLGSDYLAARGMLFCGLNSVLAACEPYPPPPPGS